MAFPGPVLPVNRTNATPQLDLHVQDHNSANQAINDITAAVKGLAPGFVAAAYVGAEVVGIQTTYTTLPGARVDFIDKSGHTYLFLLQFVARKTSNDQNADVRWQMVHSAGSVFGPVTSTMLAPATMPGFMFASRIGTSNAPANVVVQALTTAGYVNIGQIGMLAVDLGPHTP